MHFEFYTELLTRNRLLCSGGLESLFDNQKKMAVSPPESVTDVGSLIKWVTKTLIRERHDMFVVGDGLRPGVLVLINDVDWELEGTTAYKFASGDHISFISTLHGG